MEPGDPRKPQGRPAPRVSVIVPVYNGEKTIVEALESVFEQTFGAYEIIVVNDASTDRSAQILENLGDRIRFVSTKQNCGQSAARNLGTSLSECEYVAFLDQDDVWYPKKLERQVGVLDHCPEVGLIYTDVDEIDSVGRYKRTEVHKRFPMGHPKRSVRDMLIADLFILPSTVVCRKHWLELVGGFDERLGGYEDDDLWIRMWPICRFAYLPEALTKYRTNPTSSSQGPIMERSREIFKEKLMATFGDDPIMRTVVKQRFYNVYKARGTELLRRGERKRARRHYWNALKSRPQDFLTLGRLACTVLPLPVFRFMDFVRRNARASRRVSN